MGKNKILMTGIIIGTLFSMTFTAFADPVIQEVKAYLQQGYHFVINGKEVELPEDYSIVGYNNRSYLPVRFLAEQLGADVEWNAVDKTITITQETPSAQATPPAVETTSSPITVPTVPEEDWSGYTKLPQTKQFVNFNISATSYYTESSNGDRLFLTLKNEGENVIRIEQMKTKIVADGVEYSISDVEANEIDTRWYQDLEKDGKIEGYLRLPKKIKDAKHLKITILIYESNGHDITEHEASFEIAL